MRRSRLLRICGGAFLVLAVIQLAVCVYTYRDFYRCYFGFDARLRQNEIRCSHTGVNPFDVWERKISHENFRGIDRPDKETEDAPQKLLVHSYPAWHTAYLWCVGWMSTPLYMGVYYACFGVALVLLWLFVSACAPADSSARWFYFGMASIPLLYRISACFVTGNYGLFIAIFMYGLISAISAKKTISAGFLWAVMMIKPQIAVLLFWPLLIHKRYASMVISVGLCVGATCVIAGVYHCSPIDLVLQIPAIGEPYGPSQFVKQALVPLIGSHASVVWSALLFLLCGFFTWRMRKCGAWWTSLPALLLFPVWTYSQFHDGVAAWPLYVLIPLAILSLEEIDNLLLRRRIALFGLCVVGTFLVETICSSLIGIGVCSQPQCGIALGISRTIFTILCLWFFDFLSRHSNVAGLLPSRALKIIEKRSV